MIFMPQKGDKEHSYLTWVMFSNIYPGTAAMSECSTPSPVMVVFPRVSIASIVTDVRSAERTLVAGGAA